MATISKALGNAIFAKTLSDKIAEAHDAKGGKGKALKKKMTPDQRMKDGLRETGKRMMAQNKK